MKKSLWWFGFGIVGLVCMPLQSSFAQDSLPASSATSQAQQPVASMPTSLQAVVVTATRQEEPLGQTTQAVTLISGEEMQARQQTDVLQLLRDVPGITIVQTGARGGTTSLFTRGGESDYNLLLVDGVKVNNAGGFYDFSDLTTLNVERLEIVRGPQSALYGSDAISAVIQVFTPRGDGPGRPTLRLRGGNHGTFEEQLSFSGGTRDYGYSLAVGRIDSDGILPRNNAYSNTTLATRFDLDVVKDVTLTTTLRYADSRFHFPTESSGDRFDPLDPRQYQDSRRLIIGPRAVYQATSWWRHTLQLGYVQQWSTFRDPLDSVTDFGAFVSNSRESRLSADYNSTFLLPSVLEVAPTFTLGGYVESEHLHQKSDFAGSLSRVSPSRNAEALYSQLLLSRRERLFLTTGFRLDDGSTYGTRLNPRFSAAYIIPYLRTKLRGGYGEGLKAPSFIENFGTGSPFAVGNRALKPEEAKSWEIGLEQPVTVASFALELSLTYFDAKYKNLVTYVFGSTPNFLNIQRAQARGVELGLRTYVSDELSLGGTYTYLGTTVLKAGANGGTLFVRGKPLLRRPENSGSFFVNYARDRLNANLIVTLKGHAVDRDFHTDFSGKRVRLSGYTKADLALSYRLFENRWGIRALTLESLVQNLFDQDYEEVFGFSTAGASFLLGFRAEF